MAPTIRLRTITLLGLALMTRMTPAHGQVECNGWGELRGIRVDGELRRIRTTLCIARPGWRDVAATGHWRTRDQKYARDVDGRIISEGQLALGRGENVQSFRYKQTISNRSNNSATIELDATAEEDLDLEGVFLFVNVPGSEFANGHGELAARDVTPIQFATTRPANDKHYAGAVASSARFVSDRRQFDVAFDGPPRPITFQDDRTDGGDPRISLFVPVQAGGMKAGQQARLTFTITSSGEVDRRPATVTIDASQRGNLFKGLGGNFVWGTQSPVVPFYLENLRVAWARVEMPLHHWLPDEHADPTTRPLEQQHEAIRESLRMATELHRRGIPIIMSIWNAPPWMIARRDPNRPADGGPTERRVGRIDPAKWEAFEKAAGSYLVMYKNVVGAEPELFGFNEPDIGVNIRQSPQEHRDAIKRLGARFESLGLKTKLLLAEAHDPKPIDYPDATIADPDAMKHVGAIAYHSWNGGSDEQLIAWREHARKIGLPLLVTEGGTDPDAYKYRALLDEPWYALDEAAMYVRTLSLSQPESMLHWELTTDYGLVNAGENAGDPIRTTQRWWQYKQVDRFTPPAGASVIAASSDHPYITAAALATGGTPDADVIHLVNTGPARPITVTGLPDRSVEYQLVVTDATSHLRDLERVTSSGGSLHFTLPAQSFVSLVSSER